MAEKNNTYKIVVGVLAVLGVLYALHLILSLIGIAVHFLVPLALVGGIVYVVYKVSSSSKSIGGSGRRPLP